MVGQKNKDAYVDGQRGGELSKGCYAPHDIPHTTDLGLIPVLCQLTNEGQ